MYFLIFPQWACTSQRTSRICSVTQIIEILCNYLYNWGVGSNRRMKKRRRMKEVSCTFVEIILRSLTHVHCKLA